MKNWKKYAILFSSIAAILSANYAAANDDIVKKTINNPSVDALVIYGVHQTNSIITDNTVTGKKARRVVATTTPRPWEGSVQTNNTKAIKSGEEIYGVAWLKSVKTENDVPSKVSLRMQLSKEPYTSVGAKDVTLTKEWKLYPVIGVTNRDFAVNDLSFVLQVASQNQTIDVGPVFILNMGVPKPVESASTSSNEVIINNPAVNSFNVFGDTATKEIIEDKALEGEKALRIIIKKADAAWKNSLFIPTTGAIKAGDTIEVSTVMKTVSAQDKGKIVLGLQLSGAPYTGLKYEGLDISKEWAEYTLRAVADRDYAAGELALSAQLASQDQTLDVGPTYIVILGKQ